jgi:hypothetical protein
MVGGKGVRSTWHSSCLGWFRVEGRLWRIERRRIERTGHKYPGIATVGEMMYTQLRRRGSLSFEEKKYAKFHSAGLWVSELGQFSEDLHIVSTRCLPEEHESVPGISESN